MIFEEKMVYFTCNACGTSLKKNQVEKHYMHQCRRCEVLTCIDCQKDFPGDAYKVHTSCISEEEKYSAKGWQPKANANKGAKKQAAWLERLETLVEKMDGSLDKDVKVVLDAIQGYENIPRKRAKFINFCKNVLSRKFAPASIEKTWDLFEKALKEPEVEIKPSESPSIETTKETSKDTNKIEQTSSFNQWETANLGNEKQNEKFRRLMGMGKNGTGSSDKIFTTSKHASSVQDSTKLFANQEQQYEKARAITLQAKGKGLGFTSSSETVLKGQKTGQNKRKTFDMADSDDEKTTSNGKENGQNINVNETSTVHRNGIPMFQGTKDQVPTQQKAKKNKKRKTTEEDESENGNQTKKVKMEIEKNDDEVQTKFDWIDCALTVLSKKGSTKIKKLKKKVVNEFLTLHPDTVKTKVELETKFEKKLSKCKKLKISNDVVAISTSRDD